MSDADPFEGPCLRDPTGWKWHEVGPPRWEGAHRGHMLRITQTDEMFVIIESRAPGQHTGWRHGIGFKSGENVLEVALRSPAAVEAVGRCNCIHCRGDRTAQHLTRRHVPTTWLD